MSDREFVRLLTRDRERIDRERLAFLARVQDAIAATLGDEAALYDTQAHARLSAALGPIFDEFYGRYPGDLSARFTGAILDSSRESRIVAFDRSVQLARDRLGT